MDAALSTKGLRPDGGGRMIFKTAVILTWLAASWGLLVFWAPAWWAAVPLTLILGLAVAAVGFNIQHDGGHDAFGPTKWGNRLAAATLDLVGGSSYVWRYKHAIYHHTYTNIDGLDDDVDAAPFLRLTPGQKRRPWHRIQHWYMWLLFGFLPPKWAYMDDFRALARGRIGPQPMPRPGLGEFVWLIAGKIFYAAWSLVLPIAVGHSVGNVLALWLLCNLVVGICLSVIFQLAHCVEEAKFPHAESPGAYTERPWAEHQLATTVDFAPRNPVLGWYLGGLNMQVEHHLFPKVSHIHYARLQPVVKATCDDFGVPYHAHRTFFSALRSHVRHMRSLGRPVTSAAA